jgi:hypothetical protein
MSKTIEVWGPTTENEAKAALPRFGAMTRVESAQVDTDVLAKNLRDLIESFQRIADSGPVSPNGYVIEEIELSLGVNANGSIALIGKLEAGMSAAMKVKLRRAGAPER